MLSIAQLPPRAGRWLSLTVWVLVGIATAIVMVRTHEYLQKPLGAFPSYYTAAKLIGNGEDIVMFYDDNWFRRQVTEFAPGVNETHNVNPPLMGFFFLPLAQLPYDYARRLMSAFGFASLVAAALLMTAELHIFGVWRALAILAVISSSASQLNLGMAQIYPIILLLLVIAWLAWRRGNEIAGGALIGILLAVKTAGLFLWPLMVLEKRWRALLGAGAVVALLAAATFPYIGREGWETYVTYSLSRIGRTDLPFWAYSSLTGFVRTLFRYDAQLNPNPYVDAPTLAFWIELSLFIAIPVLAARVVVATKDRDISFGLAVMVTLILVPVTVLTHLCVAFLPAFILYSRIRDRLASPIGAWFILGSVLSLGPGVDRSRALLDWGGPLFYHPRFIGLVILLCLLMVLGMENRKSPVANPIPDAVRP